MADQRAKYGSRMNWDRQRLKQEAAAERFYGRTLDAEEVLEE